MTREKCTIITPPHPETNGHDYVDLGLPRGALWATMNVGASKPSDYGLYFQWGDTQGYTVAQVGTGNRQKKFASDWSDYKWGVAPDFTKYTYQPYMLDLEDDAAHVYMGGDWHMPSYEQISDLIDYTTTAWTTSDGVSGMTFTSKKDDSKSIFIPAAGYAWGGSVYDSNRNGNVWSSMMFGFGGGPVRYISCHSYGAEPSNGYAKCAGLSIRGVIG